MTSKRIWAVVVGVGMIGSACSGEDIAERVIENRIEAESGQDVDIDFDDGGLSVQTEDGEFSIRTDADGNVSIDGAGGSGDESFTIDSENGATVVETEDGTTTFSHGADVPDGFPGDVGLPDDIEVGFAQTVDDENGTAFAVGGTSTLSPAEFADELAGNLEAAGYALEQRSSPDGSAMVIYRNDERRVTAVVVTGDDGSGFQITVQPTGG